MNETISNLYQEITNRQDFQRDTEEVFAEVHFKCVQRYLDTNMSLVVIAGGQRGMQLPHYHKQGFDFFVVLQGRGLLHTADIQDGQVSTAWHHQRVEKGDSYAIDPYRAHCLLNDGDEDLVFLNMSPAAHRTDDYFVIKDVHLDRPG